MIYFEKHRDGSISKWDIEYDVEDLESIRKTVMTECHSKIRHFHKLTEEELNDRINNGNCHNLVRGQMDISTGLIDVTYDEYEYPRLVELINDLLCGDLTVLPEIESPIETGQRKYADKIASLDDEIDTIDNFDIDKKIRKLEELKAAIKSSNENKSEKRLSKYYEMVLSVIDMHLIAHLDREEVLNFEDFFDESIDKVIKKKQKSLMIEIF